MDEGKQKGQSIYLASLSKVLAKKHEIMVTAREIMDSLQEMFGQPSSQIEHNFSIMNGVTADGPR